MRYLLKRVRRLVVVIFAVTLFTFLLVNVLPGDVAYDIAGQDASEEEVQAIRADLGLDRPVEAQVGTNGLYLLLRCVLPGNVIGDITRQDVDQQEGEKGDGEDHDDQSPYPFQQVTHVCSLSSCSDE